MDLCLSTPGHAARNLGCGERGLTRLAAGEKAAVAGQVKGNLPQASGLIFGLG